ncbi:MAG TPA: hypothetical protein V6D22_13415 [Candidatus Obscuribacterales bacterium]
MVKLGDLLVRLNLIEQSDLDEALHVAPQYGLPLGRTLVLSGHLTEEELQVAVELQSLVNLKHLPVDSAKKIVALVKSGVAPAVALHGAAPEDTTEKTALGQMLKDAGIIDQHQLDETQKVSYQSGMRVGRILVLTGILTGPQLTKALELQAQVKEGQTTREKAVEQIKAEAGAKPAVQPAGSQPTKRRVRLGEFLVSAGLATESEMLNALETSLNKKAGLGETMVELGLVSRDVFDKALELHNKVSSGDMALNDAASELHRIAFGEPLHETDRQAPMLGELLKKTGLITEHDITEAIALSHKYPSVIGKMLALSGAIDEATLIASLRCQFLLRNGYLKLDDAVLALQYSKRNKMSFDDSLEELGLRKSRRA